MKWLKVIKKYYEFFVTKLKVLRDQKQFEYGNTRLKYMFKPIEGAKTLVIVFSACTRAGVAARYNYVKTLDGTKSNRLYILDDFGPDGRGSYYLGHMPEFAEQEATIALVDKIIKETNPDKIVFCGSCKGGYGALNIGSRYSNSIMIIGEPTYRIATEFRAATDLMKYWMREITEENIALIDDYLENQLRNNQEKCSQKIYLFYSLRDEYFHSHSEPLVKTLKDNGYNVVIETSDFEAHADLGLYFPKFLKEHLREYI